MTSISIFPMADDDLESDELLSLHLSLSYGTTSKAIRSIHTVKEHHWNDTNNGKIYYHEQDGNDTSTKNIPPSPISVLGARPLVLNQPSKCFMLQDNASPTPQDMSSSASSSSATSNSNDDNDDDYDFVDDDDDTKNNLTKWIYSTPTAPKLDGNYCIDSMNENDDTTTTMVSFDDDNQGSPTIVPRWKLRHEKRLALCRQRVHLERRLFETSIQQEIQRNSEAMLNSPMKPYTIRRSNNENDIYEVLWSGLVDGDGLPTGFGRLIHLETGQVYEGHCAKGLRHGQGRNVWTDNEQIYTGEWIQNQREGRGTHTWPDGRSVTGSWKKGHLHGRVFFSWPNGTTYDGDAVQGQKEGRGTQTWNNGRVYTGQYMGGSAHGVGMLTESNQSKYRGQFENGSRHGYGVQLWQNKLYEGEWSNNEVHGRGNLVWRNTGASYTGEFNHGLYHGIGIYKEGKNQYIGQWRGGHKEGEGKATWSDGRSYHGSFYRNKRHGYGRMVYKDCSFYVGGWHHGKRCGHGIGINAQGIVQHCGQWINDYPVVDDTHEKIENQERIFTDDHNISYQEYSDCSQMKSNNEKYGIDRSMSDSEIYI